MSNAKLPARPQPTDVCLHCNRPFSEHHSIDMDDNGPFAYVCDNASGAQFESKAGAEATGKLEQQLYTEDELQEAWEAGASYASDYEHGYRGKDYKTFKKQLDEYRNSNKKA